VMSEARMKLYTSDKDFDLLHQAVDKARKNAREIKVPRQSLMNMLMDHAHFIGKIKSFGETVEYLQNE
jgi:hypothetical protein